LAVLVTPAWSGNWRIDARNGGRITAGISPWQLSVELAPGERLRVPSVVVAVGTSMEDASLSLQRAVRDDWLPRTAVSDAMPVEWNHWWPYEDVEVTQDVIARNAAIGAGLGVEVVTVDAGWFGDADAASDWQEQRGDWTRVNTRRFPGGLAALGDALRAAGVTPGIWIEAEAVGASSRLRRERPEVLALAVDGRAPDPSYHAMTVSLDPTDPTFLGYVCLGSAAGREHVLESMSEVIRATGSRWLKLDFNIDPDAGCTRTDHGHGPGDGLLRHYLGLYQVLDAFRERHPEVLLESCSSGGMRIDLGLAKHVHGFFLSDPDYTEHHVEVRMGASRMLPPVALLHWSHSQWRGEHPAQQVDWAGLDAASFDTMLRAASTQRFGVSLRLVDLRPDLRERLREHLSTYRAEVVPLVRDGVLRALTGPPERGGLGERAPALQLSDEARDAHVLVAVLLDGRPAPAPVVVPRGLQPDRRYTVRDLATGRREEHTGADLAAHGLPLADDGAVTSWWVRLDPAYPDD
ncbi:MAG TPA: alpha-galactosidase, partial [Actinotalea sp.]|nr:alpha-galactosidase [Actinotalea sp.]